MFFPIGPFHPLEFFPQATFCHHLEMHAVVNISDRIKIGHFFTNVEFLARRSRQACVHLKLEHSGSDMDRRKQELAAIGKLDKCSFVA